MFRALPNDPSRHPVVYAGMRDGLSRSTDGGWQWDAQSSGLYLLDIGAIAVDPTDPDLTCAGTNGAGVFRSRYANLNGIRPFSSGTNIYR